LVSRTENLASDIRHFAERSVQIDRVVMHSSCGCQLCFSLHDPRTEAAEPASEIVRQLLDFRQVDQPFSPSLEIAELLLQRRCPRVVGCIIGAGGAQCRPRRVEVVSIEHPSEPSV